MATDDISLPPAIARRLGALLLAVAESGQAAGNTALKPLGIGVKHFGVLTFLAHEAKPGARHEQEAHAVLTGRTPGATLLSQQAIGERLRIDRTTMVALIDDLERDGLVRRERNLADRRAYAIKLTRRGESLQRRAEAAVGAASERFFEPLSDAQSTQLRKLLTLLINRSGEDG